MDLVEIVEYVKEKNVTPEKPKAPPLREVKCGLHGLDVPVRSKSPSTRILKKHNKDSNRAEYPFRYYPQVMKSFLGFSWWEGIVEIAEWCYCETIAKKRIDKYLALKKPVKRGVAEIIIYPEDV